MLLWTSSGVILSGYISNKTHILTFHNDLYLHYQHRIFSYDEWLHGSHGLYVICIHMHVYIRRGAPPPSFAYAFLCIRRSTTALVHPCVQTYIRRSWAPPLSAHRPLSRPSRSTFILSLSLTLNNHTRANRAVDVTDVVRPSHRRNSPSAVYV